MIGSNYKFSELYNDVSDYRGTGTSPAEANLTVAKKRVNDAYRRFLIYHDWSFLKDICTLNTGVNKWSYPLPDDFSNFRSAPAYGANFSYPPLTEKSLGEILVLRTNTSSSTGYPRYYSLKPADYYPIEGQRWEMVVYPNPSGIFTLTFVYKKLTNLLINGDDIPMGGPECATLIRALCLAEVELMDKKKAGEWTSQGAIELAKAVVRDSGRGLKSVGCNRLFGLGEREISLYNGRGVYINETRVDE